MDDINRYYEILGLGPNASIEEVKQAYRDLVRVWHPDRYSHDSRLQEKVQEKLKEINKAYEFICNFHASYKRKTQKEKKRDYQSKNKSEDEDTKQQPKTQKPEPLEKRSSFFKNSWVYLIPFVILIIIYVTDSLKVTHHKTVKNNQPSAAIPREFKPIPKSDEFIIPAPIEKKPVTLDTIKANVGELSIKKSASSNYYITLNAKIIYQEKNGRHLNFHSFYKDINRDEVVLIQESSATRAWFRLIILKSNGPAKITETFGNGSDLPDIKHIDKRITFKFPGGKGSSFESGFWVFENGKLLKRRDVQLIAKVPEQKKLIDKKILKPILPEDTGKPEQKRVTKRHFTIGSTKDEVLAVQGTPTGISYDTNTWNYNLSSITFDNDRVKSYHNYSNNLKIYVAYK